MEVRSARGSGNSMVLVKSMIPLGARLVASEVKNWRMVGHLRMERGQRFHDLQ